MLPWSHIFMCGSHDHIIQKLRSCPLSSLLIGVTYRDYHKATSLCAWDNYTKSPKLASIVCVMCSNVSYITWYDKNLCVTDVCYHHLTRIIRINFTMSIKMSIVLHNNGRVRTMKWCLAHVHLDYSRGRCWAGSGVRAYYYNYHNISCWCCTERTQRL